MVGGADAVVLSHGLWVDMFGADENIIGRRIALAAGEYPTRRVVGVMPADFADCAAARELETPVIFLDEQGG